MTPEWDPSFRELLRLAVVLFKSFVRHDPVFVDVWVLDG